MYIQWRKKKTDTEKKTEKVRKVLVWLQDELTESMLEKCKQSQPVIQMIVESTTDDDDGILFEALNLNDELQRVISKLEELEAGSMSGRQLTENSGTIAANASAATLQIHNESMIGASPSTHDETKTSAFPSTHYETKMSASPKGDGTESSSSSDKKTMTQNWGVKEGFLCW